MTEHQTTALETAQGELLQLQSLIELAAFAAEARRVLTEACDLAAVHREFSQQMGEIEGWRTFLHLPDSLSCVLTHAANSIKRNQEVIDRVLSGANMTEHQTNAHQKAQLTPQ